MRLTLRLFSLIAGLLGLAAAAQAQESAFAFASKPHGEVLKEEAVSDQAGFTGLLKVRPNQQAEFFLYVHNPLNAEKDYIVEFRGVGGTQTSLKTKVTIPRNSWKRVRFTKPAAPAVPPQPAAAPAAKVEATPPGLALARVGTTYQFKLLLWDAEGTKLAVDENGKEFTPDREVSILHPSDYVQSVNQSISGKDGNYTPSIELAAIPGKLSSPAVATLSIQATDPATAVKGKGLYQWTIEKAGNITLNGLIQTSSAVDSLRIYVGVDGVDRAFVYTPKTNTDTNSVQLNLIKTPAARVYPASGFKSSAVSQPLAKYPVRIETENAPAGARVQLWVQTPGITSPQKIDIGTARDEQVWLDATGPTDDSLLVTTRSRDWLWNLDLTPYVGPIEIRAVLVDAAGHVLKSENQDVKSAPFTLTVDATGPKPTDIDIVGLSPKNELLKGKPLEVSAKVNEDLTDVKRAVFFIGRLNDEKKIPAEAVKAEGYFDDAKKVWRAKLPIPTETPNQIAVSVVFINEVGLTGDEKSVTVKLVDGGNAGGAGGPAAPATGTIEGVVKIGEIPQDGVAVSLRNADGKEIASTKSAVFVYTNPKDKTKTEFHGRYKFEKVPVGAYTVLSAKQSSSYPFAAAAPVQVEADKTTKAPLSMIKIVK